MSEPCKVHVGNLSYDATEHDLRDCFEKFGKVEQGTDKDMFVIWTKIKCFSLANGHICF